MAKTQRTAPVSVEHIAQSILVFRGHKVLLDAELAALYGVSTARLNQQVRPPAATSKSPTCGQVKFPHLTAAGRVMITR